MQYSTVIVARDYARQLLTVLLALRARADVHEVILVDNDSSTDFQPIVKLSQLPVRIVRTPEHLALGAAWNIGIEAASHDCILLLHGDTLLGSNPADAIEYLEAHPEVGIVGGKLFRVGEEPRLVLHAGYDLGRGRMNPQPIGELKWDVFHDPVEVAAVSAAAMLFRRTDIRFDERYWYRYEDVDFCLQYSQRGWKVMMLPSLTGIHLENGGLLDRLRETDWAARRIASEMLYHERWCSDTPLSAHPVQRSVRGDAAQQYLLNANASIVGTPHVPANGTSG